MFEKRIAPADLAAKIGECPHDDLNVFLKGIAAGAQPGVFRKAVGLLISEDTLGVIAAHESLPDPIKTAARNRLAAILAQHRSELDTSLTPDSGSYVEEEDYGRGRYCVGCGGC